MIHGMMVPVFFWGRTGLYRTRFPFHSKWKMDLHDAAREGNLEHIRLLMEQGVDKDQSNSFGTTPLFYASRDGHFDVVQYLVEQGASVDKSCEASYTPLLGAVIRGHLEITRYLLDQGANRDKGSNAGETPLHEAIRKGHLEIAMLLMRYGANLNVRNNRGYLPIDMARTEEIKQAILDEPRRRMDEAPGKRATEQDRHPNAATSAEGDEIVQSNEQVIEGEIAEEDEIRVASEDEDSEPSSDEEEGTNKECR